MYLHQGMIIRHKRTGQQCRIVDVTERSVIIKSGNKHIPISHNTVRFSYDVPQDRFKWFRNPLWLVSIIIVAGFMVGMTSCKASTVIPNYTNTFCSVNSGADVYTGLSLNACVDEILAYSGQSSVTTFNGPIFVDCFALFCQDQWLFSSGRPIGFTPFGGQFTGWYDVLPNYTPQPTKTGVINVLQNGNTLYTLDLTYTPPNNVSEPKMFWLIIIGLLFVMFPSQPKK